MKKRIKYLSLLFTLSIFILSSCEEDSKAEYGSPEISYVITSNWSDTITEASMKDWITLLGNNFANVKSVKINDIEIDRNEIYVKPTEITFQIPSIFPEVINDLITVETDKGVATISFLMKLPDPIIVPPRSASWLFDDPTDLLKAEIGNAFSTGWKTTIPSPDGMTGYTSINDPAIPTGNKALNIAKYYFLLANHGIGPNGGGTRVNEYTIMFDFRIPSVGPWYTFLQTSPTNSGDGDIFINASGKIGNAETSYAGTVSANEWHRLVVSFKLGDKGWIKYFLDGTVILDRGSFPTDNSRYSLDSKVIFFGDNDGDDAAMDIAEIAMWNVALNEDQAALLEEEMNARQ